MDRLAEVFRRELTPGTIDSYWEALSTLDVEMFETGVRKSISESDFFPPPRRIRELSGANNPVVGQAAQANRIAANARTPHGSFDNMPPDALREHIRLLRKGIELWPEGSENRTTARRILAEREAELARVEGGEASGEWDH